MPTYTAVLQSNIGDAPKHNQLRKVEAPSVIGAMEEAVWYFGDDYWVLAIYGDPAPNAGWTLISAQYWNDVHRATYPSLHAAIADNEFHGEILIALPSHDLYTANLMRKDT